MPHVCTPNKFLALQTEERCQIGMIIVQRALSLCIIALSGVGKSYLWHGT